MSGWWTHGLSPSGERDDQHFDSWSRTYDRSPSQLFFFGPIHRAVVSAVNGRVGAGRVLDIGSGTGRLLERLGHGVGARALVGLDRSQGMLVAGQRQRPRLELLRGAAEELPFPDSSFDVVTSSVSFHHWSDRGRALTEVRRVLRPTGLFALVDIALEDIPRWGPARIVARPALAHGLLSLDERRRLLAAAGLEIVEERRTFLGRWVPLTTARPA